MSAPEDTLEPPESETTEACSTVVSLNRLPRHLGRLFLEGNDVLKPLREEHPWLNEVDRDEKANISKLQIQFYEDSFTFMKILLEFLHAKKWLEFIYSTCESDPRFGPVLALLLQHVFVVDADTSLGPASAGEYSHDNQVHLDLEKLLTPSESLSGFFKELESRSRRNMVDHNRYGRYSEEAVVEKISKTLKRDEDESSQGLKVVELWISKVNSVNEEKMAFGRRVEGLSTDGPRGLSKSIYWKKVGDNLCSLGLLVGANVPREPGEIKPKSIVAALRAAADNQGHATKVMLARLEKQNNTIRKQQQAITALQFRHVLEMVPGGGSAPPYGQATSKWQKFWDNAVAEVYKAYTQGSATSRSPLADLMEDQFRKAQRMKHDKGTPKATAFTLQEQIGWLKNESEISQRAHALYGTLSAVIHEYGSAEFSVDSLSFSPGDEKLLQAIRPDKIVDGAVDWVKEKGRYV